MKLENNIFGENIVIRSYTPSDLDFVTDMWLDEINGKYLSDPARPYVDDGFRRALDTLADSPYGDYFVVESNGRRVGSCAVFPGEDGTVYDIAYCVHRDHWRKGFGRAIVTALETWCFARGARKITAEVAVENLPSNALLRKLGYEIDGGSEFQKYNMDITYKSVIYKKDR